MWRCFGADEGETIPFGTFEFSCEVRKVLPYSKTDKRVQQGDRFFREKEAEKIFVFFSAVNMIVMVCSAVNFI